MNKEIKNILADLYKLDRGLSQHEPELIKIIKELLASRPDSGFSQEFKDNLKTEIMKRAEEIKASNPQRAPILPLVARFSYGLIGAAVMLMIVVPAIYLSNNAPTSILNISQSLGFGSSPELKQLAQNAFGRLSGSQDQITANTGTDMMLARSQNNGMDAVEAGFGDGGMSTIGMIAPDYYNYQFSYVGDDFTIDESEMDVFKRYTSDNVQTKLAQLVKSVNLGFINISSLSKAKIQNLYIVEDKEGGYAVALGLNDETASININYNQLYTVEPDSLPPSDIPSDEEIIKESNGLLARFGVNLQNYDQPTVDRSWKLYYDQQGRGEDIARYIPEIMEVIYPIIISGKTVYDEGGNPSGPRVSVNIRSGQANGAWGISSNNYQSSKYAVEQDPVKILAVALNGGYRRYYYDQSGGQTINVELGTPKLSLTAVYNYQGETYEQLLVPALVFPVVNNADQTEFYQQNIVVPLVKDLLDQNDDGVKVMPMPAIEPLR